MSCQSRNPEAGGLSARSRAGISSVIVNNPHNPTGRVYDPGLNRLTADQLDATLADCRGGAPTPSF
jgi:aspartate/methionine/tyrosine aminotransferase